MSSRALASLPRASLARSAAAPLRSVRHASGGGAYNQPSGRLFAEKPLAKGQRREKEDWERMWFWGMWGGMGLATVLLWYKPDTSIKTWAMEEAKERLEKEGGTWKYVPSANSGHPNGA